jgi:ATP-dependent helicase/nuclease subunit A
MNRPADTSKSIHLSASAGSGKTRALKERYLALLDVLDSRGLNIDQAVAITFTDKAAAEIKERVMQDLPEAALKKIIRGKQDLRISTIHSFCMNLLKRYPLEAGLPPDFGVLDVRDQTAKREKAVEDALEEGDRNSSVMGPLRDFTADELFSRVDYLLSIRSRLKRMEIDAGGAAELLRSVGEGMGREQAEADLRALAAGTTWRSSLRKMEALLRPQGEFYDECLGQEHLRLADAGDVESARPITESLASIYFNKDGSASRKCFIAKTKFTGRNRDEYEKLFFEIQALLEQFQALVDRMRSGREAISLIALFQLAEKNYQASKLREGLLDFDDLEICAYSLLQGLESADVLYWLDRKILHVLVDEFQDTSDIQWAILNKLTEEIFAGQGADKPMPPTLFVVGDEKQSIYRFREANYRLIESVRNRMETHIPPASRDILTLDRNFRSTPEVIDTVNSVFGALWGAAYKPSVAERQGHRGSVRLIELQPPQPDAPSHRSEADVLAREIRTLITTGTVVYEKTSAGSDAGSWTERPACFGDCAVLIQSRTKLKEYEAALQREHVPYRVVGGIGFYDEDEIRALMNLLFFLWNHDDRLSLAAALTSRLFGLADSDLFEMMRDGRAMIDALKHLHPGAEKLLRDWMGLAGLVPLAVLIHRIIEESGAYVRFGQGNPQAVFNIDKLLDTAREFDRRGYTTLQDFVEWVKNIRRTEQREATADMNLPGFLGSVNIMTVHKAKGLEYPLVFLPGMNQQPRSLSSGPPAVAEEIDGALRMAVKNASNAVYQELWDREREELLREHQRLLYVAMTRARDHLVMIGARNGSGKPVKQNTWLQYLHEAAPRQLFDTRAAINQESAVSAFPSALPAPVNAEGVCAPDHGETGPALTDVDLKAMIESLSPIPRSETLEWKKATDFIHHEKEETVEKLLVPAETHPVPPLARGSVLHRCLEQHAKNGSYDMNGIIAGYPEIALLDPSRQTAFIEDARRVLAAVLEKTAHAWIFEPGPQAYTELPFLYRRERTLVSGVMDRVVIRNGEGFVIDYKAILVESDAALASWLDHYRPQIEIYCEAVRQIFALERVSGYLLFLDSNILSLCVELRGPSDSLSS